MSEVYSAEEQKMNKANGEKQGAVSIVRLNDQLRIEGKGGKILMTAGVAALGDNRRQRVINALRAYDAFSPDNDPYGEHDFGELEVDGGSIMFKIDYYDLSGSHHSPNPADPAVTQRVMTVMFSDEY